MKARLAAFVIWAAVAASAMFWLLRLSASSPAAPLHTVAVSMAALPQGDLTRVFGAAPKPAEAVVVESPLASRFRLLGVAAPRQGGDRNGLALIAVDGKPARSYAVGATVDGELTLQSVHPRGAQLGAPGAQPQVKLELPPLPPAATGTLGAMSGPPRVSPPVATPAAPLPPNGVGPSAPIGLSPVAPTLNQSVDVQQGEPTALPPSNNNTR